MTTDGDSDNRSVGAGGGRRRFVLGMGCERGAAPDEVRGLAERALAEVGIGPDQLVALASIDTKRDEPAILAAAEFLGVTLRVFDAATLERETPRLVNPSELVFAHVGCHGVAESAALAAAGADARLILPKIKSAAATAAIAEILAAEIRTSR